MNSTLTFIPLLREEKVSYELELIGFKNNNKWYVIHAFILVGGGSI